MMRVTSLIFCLCFAGLWTSWASGQTPFLDIAPFARRCCVKDQNKSQVAFDYGEARSAGQNAERAADGRYIYGLQWAEERDIREVRVSAQAGGGGARGEVEYWFLNWPYSPPEMPHIEDPVDDPWQGRWLKASTKVDCEGADCRYTFRPLAKAENPLAANLPGLDYRRTLKVRLVFHADPGIEAVQIFSGSSEKAVDVRVELGAGETAAYTWDGAVRVYNGHIRSLQTWNGSAGDSVHGDSFQVTSGGSPKGLALALTAAEPSLPGSHDVTVVTLEAGSRTFSFALPDVEKGPVYIPDFYAYVSLAIDAHNFSPSIVKSGEKIREKLAREPEQTYERASREIPPLDPVVRQGGRLYLPLAADASWQKFAFEWGGNITISKIDDKAKGQELKRLEWAGNRISWRIGTGATPQYRPDSKDSQLSVLEDYLPVAQATWTTDGIEYNEEGFATLLSGPLGPDDPGRDEQTPAILMLKLRARNPGAAPVTAHLWLATNLAEPVTLEKGELLAQGGQLVRARTQFPQTAKVSPGAVADGAKTLQGIHAAIALGPRDEETVLLSLPFVPRLSAAERQQLAELNYDDQRRRVINYWRQVTDGVVPFDVPEKRFVSFAKAVIPHIRISTTKDPKSGVYMVPAASYSYAVFDNEASFQCVMLDALGDHKLAADYLEAFLRMQGSKPFLGTFTGDQKDVYHGARVDAERDYTAAEYNLDHGTALWALGEHYFYTRDRAWLEHAAPSMKRAADWVVAQRKLTELMDGDQRIPEYGLLPAGHLEDNADWAHWFSVNAFAAAGMTGLARALEEVGAPDADKYAQEAAAYKQDLRDAVLRASRLAPVIKLRDNTYVPYLPTRPYQRIRLFGPIRVAYYSRYPQKVLPTYRLSATREVLYGPMILLATDIFRTDEPLANWVLDDWEDNATMSSSLGLHVHGWVDDELWFSRGGMVFQANLQNPILTYLRRNEVPAALRNLYNDFVACLYPAVNAFTEEYRQWGSPSGPFYKIPDEAKFVNRVRDVLVREDGDALWLAAGTPRRWLAPGEAVEVREGASYFGPVSYRLEAHEGGVDARVTLPRRNPPRTAWLVLRAPEGKQLRSVEVDGKEWTDFDPKLERIGLPIQAGEIHVNARF
ncbi:MAG TPA: hypothetical protein VKO18_17585 [Terriglobia bacterium]|nr:hypothetical protein [Terriglobia bacterium]